MGIESFGATPSSVPASPETAAPVQESAPASTESVSERLETAIGSVRAQMRAVNDLLGRLGGVPKTPENLEKIRNLGQKFDQLAEIADQLAGNPEIQRPFSAAVSHLSASYSEILSGTASVGPVSPDASEVPAGLATTPGPAPSAPQSAPPPIPPVGF